MEITLIGDEVRLRPLQTGDAGALALAASESRASYGLTTVPNGLDEAGSYISGALGRNGRIPFAIEYGGRVVGSTSYLEVQKWIWPAGCSLQRSEDPDAVEIGATWLAESAQRTRCNTECKFLLLEYAFESWKVHRVTLRTDERNRRSRQAIERIGARFEGIRRADKPAVDCTVRNSAMYSIVIEEWPEVRGTLLARLGRG